VDALSAYGVVKPRLGKSNGSTICDYLRQKEAGRWGADSWVRTRPEARGEFEHEGTNVRFWHIADVPLELTNVFFEGKSGHDADVPGNGWFTNSFTET
jgi:hypothetical protein